MSNIPTGWLCPRCNKVNSPAVTCCQCGQRTAATPRVADPLRGLPPKTIRIGGQEPEINRFRAVADVERYSTRPPAA